MSRFAKGAEAIRSAAAGSGGGGKFTPEFFWKEGEERYIQFITPLEEIQKVPAYAVNINPERNKVTMRTFIDNRGFDDVEYYNPLRERWGLEPMNKNIAVVVEVEPVYEDVSGRKKRVGFQVKERTFTYQRGERAGEEVSVPNVGILIQTGKFFNYFNSWEEDKGDIREAVFKVERNNGKPVSYNTMGFEVNPTTKKDEKVELSEEVLEAVDLDEYIDMLMSPQRYHDLLDELPDDHVPDTFAARRKQEQSQKSAKETPAPSRSKAEVDDDEDEDDVASETFAKLKSKFS